MARGTADTMTKIAAANAAMAERRIGDVTAREAAKALPKSAFLKSALLKSRRVTVTLFWRRMRRLCGSGLAPKAPRLTLSEATTIGPPNSPYCPSDSLGRAGIMRIYSMAWRCELTGKTRQIGHRVSHSNRKTKRRFRPNLLNVTLLSDALGRSIRLRISANALKTVDHRGGLDAFLLKAKDTELSARVLVLKRQVTKKRAATA